MRKLFKKKDTTVYVPLHLLSSSLYEVANEIRAVHGLRKEGFDPITLDVALIKVAKRIEHHIFYKGDK